jgi:hypothetical protein
MSQQPDDASVIDLRPEQRVRRDELAITAMSVTVEGATADVTVSVSLGARQADGRASGPSGWSDQRRLAAAAMLEALIFLDERLAAFVVHDVALVDASATEVVVTVLTGDDRQRSFAGAVPVDDAGELRAAAESVLRAFPPPSA